MTELARFEEVRSREVQREAHGAFSRALTGRAARDPVRAVREREAQVDSVAEVFDEPQVRAEARASVRCSAGHHADLVRPQPERHWPTSARAARQRLRQDERPRG